MSDLKVDSPKALLQFFRLVLTTGAVLCFRLRGTGSAASEGVCRLSVFQANAASVQALKTAASVGSKGT
jgi:hypothetical protein